MEWPAPIEHEEGEPDRMADLRETLIGAARLAAKTMLHMRNSKSSKKFGSKKMAPADVVTEADIATEKALRKYFGKKMPDYNIFGEELGAKYNGNGKVIVIDPIDGTLAFMRWKPKFGTIIAVYKDGKVIGGVQYNALKDIMYVGTQETGYERIGKKPKLSRKIYLGFLLLKNRKFASMMKKEFRKYSDAKFATFKDFDVIRQNAVFEGEWEGIFIPTLSLHDLGPAILFAKLTGTKVTDHRGRRLSFDPEKELRKYKDGRKEVIYSQPIVIAKPKQHKMFMKALKPFNKYFDDIARKGNV